MYLILKEFLFLLLSFLDIQFTQRKLSELGVEAEINSFIKKCCYKFGIEWGVNIGISLPTFALASLGWFFPDVLTFMIGFRTLLFFMQVRTKYGNDSKN